MKVNCPVCGGSGRIPQRGLYGPISYLGPNGESWPMETCPGCGGSGIQETERLEPLTCEPVNLPDFDFNESLRRTIRKNKDLLEELAKH